MLYKMESNRYENEQKSELGGACRWDACALGQGVSNEGDQLLAKGQDMGPIPSKIDGSDSAEETVYYAVSIPIDSCVGESDETLHVYTDRSEAMKIMKKHKKARFKSFKLREEAVEFAVQGPETVVISSSGSAENLEAASGIVGEKPSPFKGPKSQDLVRLRKVIECGDIDTFTVTVWDNPRYLVSSGDTPAILQEGSRYNALHVAAKARNAEICSLILETVGNVAFIQLLYGDDDDASCKDRARILVDLYLNTPDKALNETPLHFAVKFGSLSVVDVLVSYPQCDKNARNKFAQAPRDVVCSRVSSPEAGLRRALEKLLDDRFYVPVLRSEDNSVQAAVGEPFSPACPLVLKVDPVSPRMEIRAYAGPMDLERAQVFRKRWKTPPRVPRTATRISSGQAQTGSPNCHSFRLLDVEKGLERVGRDLAQEFKVGWNEYWPFLDTFINLASQDGLQKLEGYLKKRFLEAWQQQNDCDVSNTGFERNDNIKQGCATASPESSESQSGGNEVVSPVTDLCFAFKACSLSDVSPGKPLVQSESRNARNVSDYQGRDSNVGVEDEALLDVLLNPGLSPFLYVDKSCHVFAKRIFDGLAVVAHSAQIGDVLLDVLQPEIRHLQGLVSSFKDDARFVSVDFDLVHSRIAELVAVKLVELTGDEVDFIVLGLKSALSPSRCCYSDEEDDVIVSYRNAHTYADRQRKREGERNQIRCIAEHILGALDKRETDKQRNRDSSAAKVIHPQKEEDCIRIWSEAIQCPCFRHNQNFVRNARKTSSYKRRHSVRYMPSKNKADAASPLDGITRRLAFEGEDDSDQQYGGEMACRTCEERTADQQRPCGNDKQTSDIAEVDESHEMTDASSESCVVHKLSESDDTSDAEEYFTPPSSPEKLGIASRSSCGGGDDDDDGVGDPDMSTADEGPVVFIQGDSPSRLDVTVMQALDGSNIQPAQYPNIYRWRHSVLLHSEHERATWPSPFCSRPKEQIRTLRSPDAASAQCQRNVQLSTPPQAWYKITGPYSPLRSQLYEGNMDHVCKYSSCGVCTECRAACSCTLHGTQYTHHNLKHTLPQHCTTYNDVFLLIKSIKV